MRSRPNPFLGIIFVTLIVVLALARAGFERLAAAERQSG